MIEVGLLRRLICQTHFPFIARVVDKLLNKAIVLHAFGLVLKFRLGIASDVCCLWPNRLRDWSKANCCGLLGWRDAAPLHLSASSVGIISFATYHLL